MFAVKGLNVLKMSMIGIVKMSALVKGFNI